METLPVAEAPAPFKGHVRATDTADGVIRSLMQFGDPSPAVPNPPPPASRVHIRVVNGSGDPNAGQLALTQLRAAGFQVSGSAEEGDRTNYQQTQIRYAPGKYAEGYTTLAGCRHTQPDPGDLRAEHPWRGRPRRRRPGLHAAAPGDGRDDRRRRNRSRRARRPASSTSSSTTTSTTVAPPTVDTRFVPVDPKTHEPLVGCPHLTCATRSTPARFCNGCATR